MARTFICTACDHHASDHLWDPEQGGSLADGPYRCHCGCEQIQKSCRFVPLTQTTHKLAKS